MMQHIRHTGLHIRNDTDIASDTTISYMKHTTQQLCIQILLHPKLNQYDLLPYFVSVKFTCLDVWIVFFIFMELLNVFA